ncbi:hypothetical protein OAU50_04530 [Planctomycetota bacterium]|nr:hypothetical protein [Planctomycetota bacterium]
MSTDAIGLEAIDDNGDGTIDKWYYDHRNQRGDLIGMTDETGIRVSEIDHGKYGEVYHKDVIFDGKLCSCPKYLSLELINSVG